MNRYLVTGGAGFIGSHLAQRLLDEGQAVRVLDDFSTGQRENIGREDESLEIVEACITSEADVAAAMLGVDGVFHLAGHHENFAFLLRGFLFRFLLLSGCHSNLPSGCGGAPPASS